MWGVQLLQTKPEREGNTSSVAEYRKVINRGLHWNEATLSDQQPKKGKALVCASAAAEEGFCSRTARAYRLAEVQRHSSGPARLQSVGQLGQGTLVINHADVTHVAPHVLMAFTSRLRCFLICRDERERNAESDELKHDVKLVLVSYWKADSGSISWFGLCLQSFSGKHTRNIKQVRFKTVSEMEK